MSASIPNLVSWPLGGVDSSGRLAPSMHVASVEEVFVNILLTRPGERLMRPEFGAGLVDFIHQPNNETTRQLMADVARKSIEQWEPRVIVESVTAMALPTDPSLVQLSVNYRLRYDPAPRAFSLAFNLEQLT